MKKLIIIIAILMSFKSHTFSQNLVPNQSFEQYTNCPSNDGQLYLADGWSKYSSSSSTPDYYNVCSQDGFGIPYSLFSNQNERRNCNAYVGLVTWGSSGGDREYLGITLSEQLIIGQKYFLSFYLVQSEYFLGGTYYGMPSNGMGIRLSTASFSDSNPCPIDNFCHLYVENIVTDSVNWTKISGSIIADSAYKYLIIGNFFDDNNTTLVPYQCGNCLNSGSYYLVDDICISTDSLTCNPVSEVSCDVSINKQELNELKIYPNPSSGKFTIENINSEPFDILIYDTYGNLAIKIKMEYIDLNIDLSALSKGIYIIKGFNANKKDQYYNKIIIH